MTELIAVPDPEPGWGPAASPFLRADNPVWQPSAFDVATTMMQPLVLLAVDVEAVAHRLNLHLEELSDGFGGTVRAAFFFLDRIDYAISCNGGEPLGTHVWVSSLGPVDLGERLGVLLDVLGIGMEAVAQSAPSGAEDYVRGIPPGWRRQRPRPAMSHQEFWNAFKKRPGMRVGRVRFDRVISFLHGYDVAFGGKIFAGFQEWLTARARLAHSPVSWEGLALRELLPQGRPPEPWPGEHEDQVIEDLFKLIDEFFEDVAQGRYVPPTTTSPIREDLEP